MRRILFARCRTARYPLFIAGTYTNLLTHVVFSTKDRFNLITPRLESELHPYLGGIINGEKGKVLAVGGTPNHVHILAVFSPSISFSEMLQRIKGNSSAWINKTGRCDTHFAWQRGYGAFAVSESAKPAVLDYIHNQKEHHKVKTFEAEFRALLRRHQVSFEEKYLWD